MITFEVADFEKLLARMNTEKIWHQLPRDETDMYRTLEVVVYDRSDGVHLAVSDLANGTQVKRTILIPVEILFRWYPMLERIIKTMDRYADARGIPEGH